MGGRNKPDFILYVLFNCYSEYNKKLKGKPIEVRTSKKGFIDIIMKAKVVGIKERAIYKHLEKLEKTKYITYNNRMISVTKKGMRTAKEHEKMIEPYVKVKNILQKTDISKLCSKAQTRFTR